MTAIGMYITGDGMGCSGDGGRKEEVDLKF